MDIPPPLLPPVKNFGLEQRLNALVGNSLSPPTIPLADRTVSSPGVAGVAGVALNNQLKARFPSLSGDFGAQRPSELFGLKLPRFVPFSRIAATSLFQNGAVADRSLREGVRNFGVGFTNCIDEMLHAWAEGPRESLLLLEPSFLVSNGPFSASQYAIADPTGSDLDENLRHRMGTCFINGKNAGSFPSVCLDASFLCRQKIRYVHQVVGQVIRQATQETVALVLVNITAEPFPVEYQTRRFTRSLLRVFVDRNFPLISESQPGNLSWIAACLFFGFNAIVGATLIIFSLWKRFWLHDRFTPLMIATCIVVVGDCLMVAYWAFYARGFWIVGTVHRAAFEVEVVGRAGNLLFLMSFAVLTWLLVDAMLETFGRREGKVSLVLAIVFAAVVSVISIYAVVMAVLPQLRLPVFLIDLTQVLISATQVAFGLTLLGLLVLTWRLLREEKRKEMKRNVIVMAVVAAVLCCVLIGNLVISCLGTVLDYLKYRDASLVLACITTGYISLAVLAYMFLNVRGTHFRRSKSGSVSGGPESDGYTPLEEGGVPAAYANF